MQKIFITLLFLLFIGALFAQSTAFPTGNAVWGTHCIPIATDHYAQAKLSGDSLYNGQQYAKAYEISSFNDQTLEYVGLSRAQGDRVFFIQKDSTFELLLYDFSLVQGDTFWIDGRWFGDTLQYFDTVFDVWEYDDFADGSTRKTFVNNSGNYWDEGIGAIGGKIFKPLAGSFANPCRLSCFINNGTTVVDDNCDHEDLTITAVEEINEDDINIYPNPFSNELHIQSFSKNGIEQFFVFDANGQKIPITEKDNVIRFDKNLPVGIYFLRIEFDNKSLTKKVLKF